MKRTSNKDIPKFDILEEIGRGGFGIVYKAKWKEKHVAIKKISKKNICLDKHRKNLTKEEIDQYEIRKSRIKQEIEIHESLFHPSIVKFETWFQDAESYCLILEYCNKGTLEELLKNRNHGLSEPEAHDIIKEVSKGIKYLHDKDILHRDITLRNILLTEYSSSHMGVKITDFGMATRLRHQDDVKRTVLGTPNYMPPEMIMRDPHSYRSDIWSLGCVLYALLVGKLPFEGGRAEEVYNNALMSTAKIPHYINVEARSLICNLLEKDPSQRPSINVVLNHQFFKKYGTKSGIYECQHDRSGDSGRGSWTSSSRSHGMLNSDLNSANSYNNEQFNNATLKRNIQSPCSCSKSTSELKLQQCYMDTAKIRSKDALRRCKSAERPAVLENLKNTFSPNLLLPTRRNCLLESPLPQEIPLSNNQEHRISQERIKQDLPHNHYFHVNRLKLEKTRDQLPSDEGQYYSNPYVESGIVSPDNSRRCYSDQEHYGKCRKQSCKFDQSLFPKKQNDAHRFGPSCSHEKYCYQKNTNCSHEMACSCQHDPTHNYHLSYDPSNELKPCVKKDIKQDITPLNTVRLPPKRLETKNAVVTISEEGQVFLEFFKIKNGKKRISLVYCISTDGRMISVCKPKERCIIGDKPPSFPSENKYYTFETLPETHCKNYLYAKRFIDIIRSKTPKITIYGKQAKCQIMENLPDPDFLTIFYDGNKITKVADRISITDKNGRNHLINHDDLIPKNYMYMWEIYEKMQTQCKILEEFMTSKEIPFPATFGKRPESSLGILHSSSKENVFPYSDMLTNTNRKSGGIKYISFNGDSMNSTQITPSGHNSKSNKNISDLESILRKAIPNLKGCPELKDGKVVAEYIDGVLLLSSKNSKEVSFWDRNTGKRIEDFLHNSKLKRRLTHDLKIIMKYMISSEKIT